MNHKNTNNIFSHIIVTTSLFVIQRLMTLQCCYTFTPQFGLSILSSTNGIHQHQHQHHRLYYQQNKETSCSITIPLIDPSVYASEHAHGMPWKTSIVQSSSSGNENGAISNNNVYYLPFWEYQMEYMKKHLKNLKGIPVISKTGRDMSYKENSKHDMRIYTALYESDEYKSIRTTIVDAGERIQVFTSLWYPRCSNQPLLGIDLLKFNKKHVCVMDFQPVTDNNDDARHCFEKKLQPIREQYKSLQCTMTDRFYNADDPYFSKQMLIGRHDTGTFVHEELMPAFQQYMKVYVDLVQQEQERNNNNNNKEHVSKIRLQQQLCDELHSKYDTYSAARDPAHHLLAKSFGQEWADEYVYDILFPLAGKKKVEFEEKLI